MSDKKDLKKVEKIDKLVKIKIFKKPLKEKQFNKKFLKFIELPKDKQFFILCFDLKDGIYTVKSTLDADSAKKLKALNKIIKKNKGAVKIVPLVITSALAAAIILFFTIFLNPFLEKTLEGVLENVFEARVEINRFNLSLIRMNISVNSLIIADRDKPMQNLIETGQLAIRLNPNALVRGKVYIEEIRSDSLQFGTPRKTSGALPAFASRKQEAIKKEPSPPLIDFAKFDAKALLDEQLNKLSSTKAFDEAIQAYNDSTVKWKEKEAATRTRITELQSTSQSLLKTDVRQIKTPDEVTKTVKQINDTLSASEAVANEVSSISSEIKKDANTALKLEQNARQAVNADIAYLKSLVDIKSGAALEIFTPVVKNMLSDSANTYIAYGSKALEVSKKIDDFSKTQKKENPKKEVFKGRNVTYPAIAYPGFFLKIFSADFTLQDWKWEFLLKDVTSAPNITPNPTTLFLGLSEAGKPEGKQFSFSGLLNLRDDSQEYYSGSLKAQNIPVNFKEGFPDAGIGGFSGSTSITTGFSGDKSGGIKALCDIIIRNSKISSASGTFAEAFSDAVREANNVTLGIKFASKNDKQDFSVSSNILSIISSAMFAAAQRYAKKAQEDIEKTVRSYIAANFENKLIGKKELDAVVSAVQGDMSAINTIKADLTKKRAEIENSLKNSAQQAVDKAADKAASSLKDKIKLPGR